MNEDERPTGARAYDKRGNVRPADDRWLERPKRRRRNRDDSTPNNENDKKNDDD